MFSLNKSQFSVNSVFAVKVKIPFSHLLNRAYPIDEIDDRWHSMTIDAN